MRRQRVLPAELRPAWEAFATQAERVQQAREALLSCLPMGRGTQRAPVRVGVELIRDELDAVRPEMEAWRVEAVEAAWQDCASATDRARARVDRALAVADHTDAAHDLYHEVAAIVQPLEAWADAEDRWEQLRRRRRRGD